MAYRIAGIDVRKRMLDVVVSDVEMDGEYDSERRQFGSNPGCQPVQPVLEKFGDSVAAYLSTHSPAPKSTGARLNGINAPHRSSSPTFAAPFNHVACQRYQQLSVSILDGHSGEKFQQGSFLSPNWSASPNYGGFRLSMPGKENLIQLKL